MPSCAILDCGLLNVNQLTRVKGVAQNAIQSLVAAWISGCVLCAFSGDAMGVFWQ